MARKDAERRYQLALRRWDVIILILRIIHALLRTQIIVLWIILAMAPVAPYLRVSDTETGQCRYIGARGLWEPGWAGHCRRVAIREHFFVSY